MCVTLSEARGCSGPSRLQWNAARSSSGRMWFPERGGGVSTAMFLNVAVLMVSVCVCYIAGQVLCVCVCYIAGQVLCVCVLHSRYCVCVTQERAGTVCVCYPGESRYCVCVTQERAGTVCVCVLPRRAAKQGRC